MFDQLGLSPAEVLLSFAYSGVILGVFGAVVIGAIVQWDFTRSQLQRGLRLALIMLALGAPMAVFNVLFLRMAPLEQLGLDGAPGRIFLAIGMLLSLALSTAYRTVQVPVILLAGQGRPPFPLLSGAKERFAGWPLAAAIGLGGGALSTVAFTWLGVQPGQFLKNMAAEAYPDVDLTSPVILLGVVLPAVLGIAMAEELIFRGLIQRWLHRWLGGSQGAAWAAIGIAAVIWSLGHAPNTDAVALKLGQTMILGFAFGWLALRYSVETAMVAHVGLNFSAVIASLFIGGD